MTMAQDRNEIRGAEVIRTLAEKYQQLYLAPGEKSMAAYRAVVARGEDAPEKSLGHFHTTPKDSCGYVDTPAGEVLVITLRDRQDFETFIQIMTCKCEPKPVPATQGAAILLGVISWPKLRKREQEFREEARAAGRPDPTEDEWLEERSVFLQKKENYTDKIIILSAGPYSNLPAERAGFEEGDWLEKSWVLRKYHECTHFVCRTLYPQLVDFIWDEVVADAAGIRAALGRFDGLLAERVLGLEGDKYAGGRLENYIPKEVEDREKWLAETSRKIHGVIREIQEISDGLEGEPFDLVTALEERKTELWG